MQPPLLPAFSSLAEYSPLHKRAEIWLPAVREICDRHGLSGSELVHRPEGGNVIFLAGQGRVIKLFGPLWGEEQAKERTCLVHVERRLPVRTPAIAAEGELEGWPYLVLERLPGETLGSQWPSMRADDQVSLARALGELIRALHRLPTTGLELASDWPAFIAERRARCEAQHRGKGAPDALVRGISGALASGEPLYPEGFEPVLVHADVTDCNVLVELRGGRWELAGLLDFGDAMVGHADYDLVSTAEFLLCGRPPLLRAFLLGYGLAEDQLDERLSARLMALTLLHRFASLERMVQKLGRPAPFETLAELAAFAWRTSS